MELAQMISSRMRQRWAVKPSSAWRLLWVLMAAAYPGGHSFGADPEVTASNSSTAAHSRGVEAFSVLAAFEHIPEAGRSAEDWRAWMEQAGQLGYTDFFAELAYGGYAHYPSAFYESSAASRRYGDQVAHFVAAARSAGLAPHVVKLVFNVEYGRTSRFLKEMGREGRLMKQWNPEKQSLEQKLWLAPAHPANQKMTKNIVLEIINKYDVAGINLDYIRYPRDTTDFSDISRAEFERHLGQPVEQWPEDVLPHWRKKGAPTGSRYEEFRVWQAGVVTAFLKDLYKSVKEADPEVVLSAAVFADPDSAYGHGQDWREWVKLGIIDAVYPMNYTSDNQRFAAWLEAQRVLPGPADIYPAIRIARDETNEIRATLAAQIDMILSKGFDGMMIWKYEENLLPSNAKACDGMVPNFEAGCRAGLIDVRSQQ